MMHSCLARVAVCCAFRCGALAMCCLFFVLTAARASEGVEDWRSRPCPASLSFGTGDCLALQVAVVWALDLCPPQRRCMCDPDNYRGLHLTPQLSKATERFVAALFVLRLENWGFRHAPVCLSNASLWT
eukprot:3969086-Pyramimonas_sp.AAC.1